MGPIGARAQESCIILCAVSVLVFLKYKQQHNLLDMKTDLLDKKTIRLIQSTKR